MQRWIDVDHSSLGAYQYQDIERKIVMKLDIRPPGVASLMDHEFFCCHGEPAIVRVAIDRFGGHARNFYSTEWEF